MDLHDVQHEHMDWINHNFPGQSIWQAFAGIAEETGELAHHLLKREQNIRGNNADHEAGIRDSCADLIIFMCGLADLEGFDLMDEVEEVWMKVRGRDWIKYPHDGVTR